MKKGRIVGRWMDRGEKGKGAREIVLRKVGRIGVKGERIGVEREC